MLTNVPVRPAYTSVIPADTRGRLIDPTLPPISSNSQQQEAEERHQLP